MQEAEILLIMSNFSFSDSVYKRLIVQTCKKKKGLFGKELTNDKLNLALITLSVSGRVVNTVEKRIMLITSIFSFFHNVFNLFQGS